MLANNDRAARLRRLWLKLHLWVGLSLGLLLVVLGLSGSILVWRDSLEWLSHPARYAVTIGGPSLRPSTYMQNATAALGPGFQLQGIRYPEHDGDPVTAPARGTGAGPLQIMTAFLDPPTGRVLDVADIRSSALGILHRFHENLTIPEHSGRTIVGWGGIAMLISALTGVWLWWPRNGAFWRGLRWRRGPGTASNLHHRLGIFLAVPLAVVSLTGIYIAFPQQGREVLGSIFPLSPPPPRPITTQPLPRTALAIDQVLDIALTAAPGARPAGIMLPSRQTPAWWITLVRPDSQSVTVTVDDATSTVKVSAAQARPGDRIAQWMRWLHEGSHSGPVWRLAVFCSGLCPAVFFVTGMMIWWRRRRLRGAVAPAPDRSALRACDGTVSAGS